MIITSKITRSTTAIATRYSTRYSDFLLLLSSNSTRSQKPLLAGPDYHGIVGFFIARIKWIFLSPDQKKFTWDQFPAHFKGKSTKRGRSGALKSKLYWKWTILIIYISWIVYVLVWILHKLTSRECFRKFHPGYFQILLHSSRHSQNNDYHASSSYLSRVQAPISLFHCPYL